MKTCTKIVSAILDAPAPHMVGDGFSVSNFFPKGYHIKMSPFFLLDSNAKTELSPSDQPRGVGVHPHRGFETVTIAYHGAIAHHDSAGNNGVINAGDVQWMTAGRGIIHKEYYEEEFNNKGGTFQMVQLWINLPAKDKMSTPKYQAIKHSELSKFKLPADSGYVEVIAGQYNGVTGPASTFTDINVYNVRLDADGEAVFNFPEEHNTGFLVIEGSLSVNNAEQADVNQFVYFSKEGSNFKLKALKNSIVLLLSGAPIDEPIAQYGPFLMNTQEEIKQAINDYNKGKFGYLDE